MTFIVTVASLAVMVMHCCILFEQKSQLWVTFKGGKVFWNIYISMIMQSLTDISVGLWNIYAQDPHFK